MSKSKATDALTDNDRITIITSALKDKKAQNILSIDLSSIEGAIVPHFIVCNADSTVHVRSLAEHVEEEFRLKTAKKPLRRQGVENNLWIILDYGDIMVHIMETQTREFYQLERLWADAPIQRFEDEHQNQNSKRVHHT